MKRVISTFDLAIVLVVAGPAAAQLAPPNGNGSMDKANASSSEVHFYSSDQVKKASAKDPSARPGSVSNGRAGVLLNAKDNPKFQVTIRRHDEENDPEVHDDHTHVFYVLDGAARSLPEER
jgi:hypothetical protein